MYSFRLVALRLTALNARHCVFSLFITVGLMVARHIILLQIRIRPATSLRQIQINSDDAQAKYTCPLINEENPKQTIEQTVAPAQHDQQQQQQQRQAQHQKTFY